MAGLRALGVVPGAQQGAYPIPPHRRRGNFDRGILKKPIAPGTETLLFDKNTILPQDPSWSMEEGGFRRRTIFEDI